MATPTRSGDSSPERQPNIDAPCRDSNAIPGREGLATPRNGSHLPQPTHGTYYEAEMRLTVEIHDDDLIELAEISWVAGYSPIPATNSEASESAPSATETEATGEATEPVAAVVVETEITIEVETFDEVDELLEASTPEADDDDDEPVAYQPGLTASAWRVEQREDAASLRQSEFDRLFNEWRTTQDPQLRERLILMNRNLVSYLARKFLDRGELSEDIIQQGLIGLINALDHFDPARGVRFATFATPTIMGEIRRYFRDKTWGIRVPRRLQELNQVINAKIEDLTQELDRSPSYPEIARALGLQVEEVVEALEMVHALEPMSIEEEVFFGSDDSATVVGDQLGANDPHLEGWNEHAALGAALEKLPENERTVLQLAYFEELSQTEIARRMQVSQMYISRLQRKALSHLRELLNSTDV